MTDRVLIPGVDEIMALDDAGLAALKVRCADALGEIDGKIVAARDAGQDDRVRKLRGAAWHFQRGLRTIRAEQDRRTGRPTYAGAKAVVDVPTAVAAHKAILRLLGLLDDEHHAVAHWIAADDDHEDEAWQQLVEAHDRVVDALAAARGAS